MIRYICDKTFLELSKKLLWLFGVVGEALFFRSFRITLLEKLGGWSQKIGKVG